MDGKGFDAGEDGDAGIAFTQFGDGPIGLVAFDFKRRKEAGFFA